MDYIFGVIILILDIIAIISVWSSGTSMVSKLLWTLLILILPVIGLIAWYFLGPKRGRI